MKRWTYVLGVVLVAATLLPSLVSAAGPYPQTRQGWLVGLGLGGGSAGLTADGESSDRTGGGAGSFRVGYAFQPQLSVDLNSSAWSKSENSTTLTFDVAAIGLSYYPAAVPGLLVHGGIGSGTESGTVVVGNTKFSESQSGLGFSVGAGWEFRLARTFAVGPEVNYGWMSLDSFDANYINGGIAATWYFVPK